MEAVDLWKRHTAPIGSVTILYYEGEEPTFLTNVVPHSMTGYGPVRARFLDNHGSSVLKRAAVALSLAEAEAAKEEEMARMAALIASTKPPVAKPIDFARQRAKGQAPPKPNSDSEED